MREADIQFPTKNHKT